MARKALGRPKNASRPVRSRGNAANKGVEFAQLLRQAGGLRTVLYIVAAVGLSKLSVLFECVHYSGCACLADLLARADIEHRAKRAAPAVPGLARSVDA